MATSRTPISKIFRFKKILSQYQLYRRAASKSFKSVYIHGYGGHLGCQFQIFITNEMVHSMLHIKFALRWFNALSYNASQISFAKTLYPRILFYLIWLTSAKRFPRRNHLNQLYRFLIISLRDIWVSITSNKNDRLALISQMCFSSYQSSISSK